MGSSRSSTNSTTLCPNRLSIGKEKEAGISSGNNCSWGGGTGGGSGGSSGGGSGGSGRGSVGGSGGGSDIGSGSSSSSSSV